jgi:hypothetical protein
MSEDAKVVEGVAAVAGDAGGAAVETTEVAALRALLLHSELKAEAIRAGMVDLDGVKLIDMAGVKVTEAGELVDGAKVMSALRAAKPWLFGRSSSSVAQAPRAEAPKAKTAMDMSVDEWRAARAELLRRR